jgi:tetratricopeptide (TPR) repeat protein
MIRINLSGRATDAGEENRTWSEASDWPPSLVGRPKGAYAMLTRERFFTLVGVILIAITVVACSSDPEALVDRALELAGEGEPEKAMELFDKALEKDPSRADTYYSRATVWMGEGDHNQAAADLDEVLSLAPDFRIATALAVAYYERGLDHKSDVDLETTVADFSRALSIDEDYTDALAERALAYRQQGEYDAAASDLDTLLELDPDHDLTSEDAEVYFRRALGRMDAGDLDLAVADYEMATGLDPHHTQAMYNCGLAHLRAGDNAAALVDLDEALDLTPDLTLEPEVAGLFFDRGMAALNNEQLEAATTDLSLALRADPEHTAAASGRGMAFLGQGKLNRAVDDFSLAIDLDPENAGAYADRATAYMEQEQPELALADYDQAIALDPANLDPLLGRADIRLNMGDVESAIEDFTAVVDIDPEHVQATFSRAMAHRELEQTESAITDLERVIELEPDHMQANYNLGIAYLEAEQYEAAINRFDQVLILEPENIDVYYRRSTANQALGNVGDAIIDLSMYIENMADDDKLYSMRGDLYFEAERFHEATEDYKRAVELNPNQPEYWFNLGLIGIETDELEEALGAFDEVISLEPEMADAYFRRAETYERMADAYEDAEDEEQASLTWESAIDDYTTILELDPENLMATERRGIVRVHIGEFEAAIEDLSTVIEANPESAEFFYHRATAWVEIGEWQEAKADVETALELGLEADLQEAAENLLEQINQALKPSGMSGVPIMPGATDVVYYDNGGRYNIDKSLAEIQSYYTGMLPAYGWRLNQPDIVCPEIAVILVYEQGGQLAVVTGTFFEGRPVVLIVVDQTQDVLEDLASWISLVCLGFVF